MVQYSFIEDKPYPATSGLPGRSKSTSRSLFAGKQTPPQLPVVEQRKKDLDRFQFIEEKDFPHNSQFTEEKSIPTDSGLSSRIHLNNFRSAHLLPGGEPPVIKATTWQSRIFYKQFTQLQIPFYNDQIFYMRKVTGAHNAGCATINKRYTPAGCAAIDNRRS